MQGLCPCCDAAVGAVPLQLCPDMTMARVLTWCCTAVDTDLTAVDMLMPLLVEYMVAAQLLLNSELLS